MVDLSIRDSRLWWSVLLCCGRIAAYIYGRSGWRTNNCFSFSHTSVWNHFTPSFFSVSTFFSSLAFCSFPFSAMPNNANDTQAAPVATSTNLESTSQVADTVRLEVLESSMSRLIVGFKVGRSLSTRRFLQVHWTLGGFVQCFGMVQTRKCSTFGMIVGIRKSICWLSDGRVFKDSALARFVVMMTFRGVLQFNSILHASVQVLILSLCAVFHVLFFQSLEAGPHHCRGCLLCERPTCFFFLAYSEDS